MSHIYTYIVDTLTEISNKPFKEAFKQMQTLQMFNGEARKK